MEVSVTDMLPDQHHGLPKSDPLWFKRAVFYEVLVRSFKDSNADGIGDLQGLTEKLDYLEWLGVDCLWLPPFYPSPLRDAVTGGLARGGRIVSMAAVILAVSFFAFGTSSVSFIQLFGLGSGLAVLIDATLIRGVLVPVAMRLMGRNAWWAPKPLRRLHDLVGVSETGAQPVPQ